MPVASSSFFLHTAKPPNPPLPSPNTSSRPSIAGQSSSTASACGDNGTMCALPFLVRSFGRVRASSPISDQRRLPISALRWPVSMRILMIRPKSEVWRGIPDRRPLAIGQKTRSRLFALLCRFVPSTGLDSRMPSPTHQPNIAERVLRARSACTAPLFLAMARNSTAMVARSILPDRELTQRLEVFQQVPRLHSPEDFASSSP